MKKLEALKKGMIAHIMEMEEELRKLQLLKMKYLTITNSPVLSDADREKFDDAIEEAFNISIRIEDVKQSLLIAKGEVYDMEHKE